MEQLFHSDLEEMMEHSGIRGFQLHPDEVCSKIMLLFSLTLLLTIRDS